MKLSSKNLFKTISASTLAILLLFTATIGIHDYITGEKTPRISEELPVFLAAEVSEIHFLDSEHAAFANYKLLNSIPLNTSETYYYKDKTLIPGGMPFGIKFLTDGLLVSGFADVEGNNGRCNPARDAGLRINDIITKINGIKVTGTGSLREAVQASGGNELEIIYLRGGKEFSTKISPIANSSDGLYKTGVMIRDSGAGIGTVSFIDEESGLFAGLGHGICEGENGTLIPISRGAVLDVTISGVEKGLSGTPGEIKGFFNPKKIGTMNKNTHCGVYGLLTEIPQNPLSKPLKIGLKNEICDGPAKIYCTLGDDGICEYSIEISHIDKNAEGGKCFSIRVTDPRLIERTGGIIQGMSGSPIIQNGKLVGAVTHVLVNDPSRGYGIFIENMLNEANTPMALAS